MQKILNQRNDIFRGVFKNIMAGISEAMYRGMRPASLEFFPKMMVENKVSLSPTDHDFIPTKNIEILGYTTDGLVPDIS